MYKYARLQLHGFLFLSLFLLVGVLVVPAESAEKAPKMPFNVILIGWDAVQRDHLKECLSRNECPNLVKLAEEGALMKIDITTGATDTKAGWTQILTGYDPEKTGVYNNSRYQPIPEGCSILERVENRFGPDNVVTVFLAGKKNHVGARGPHVVFPKARKKKAPNVGTEADFEDHKIVETGLDKASEVVAATGAPSQPQAKNGKSEKALQTASDGAEPKGRRMAGEPHYYASLHVDKFENGLNEAENVGTKALQALEEYKDKPFFFFIHFQEPDPQGHKSGENSEQYTKGITTDDEWLGKITAKLKELNLYDKTRIYVACDHGFDEGRKSHKNAPYVFFATNDEKVGKAGDRKDVTPTILSRLGFDLDKIEPTLDGKPLLKKKGSTEEVW